MATQILVSDDLEKGKAVLKAIDEAHLNVRTAFWLSTDGNWRLMLATPLVDQEGHRQAYKAIQAALAKCNPDDVVPLRQIEVISVTDPRIQAVKSLRKNLDITAAPIRFSNNVIKDILIEDSYIYRST